MNPSLPSTSAAAAASRRQAGSGAAGLAARRTREVTAAAAADSKQQGEGEGDDDPFEPVGWMSMNVQDYDKYLRVRAKWIDALQAAQGEKAAKACGKRRAASLASSSSVLIS